jgi:hypothetical protein
METQGLRRGAVRKSRILPLKCNPDNTSKQASTGSRLLKLNDFYQSMDELIAGFRVRKNPA